MLTRFPTLVVGVADKNGCDLNCSLVVLRLAGVAFRREHIFDSSQAPRGQLSSSSTTAAQRDRNSRASRA
jgi:hypothetical protein